MSSENSSVGESIKRTDGRKFVTGSAEYAADIDQPHQAHMALLRSPHAHAEIGDIDVSAALEMDGVRAVITGEDMLEETNPKGLHEEEYGLATDRVRYYGEPVAAVAADSKYVAQDAVERIFVEYDPLDATIDPTEAITENSDTIHPELQEKESVSGNVSQEFSQRIGDVDAGFEEADHVYERTYTAPRINGAPMEPHACVVDYDGDSGTLTSHTTTQIMHPLKEALANVFDLPVNSVRVKLSEVGGGFGNKLNLIGHEICAGLLSKQIDRPVKAVLSRQEHLEVTKSSFQYVMDVTVGVTDDGRITAWEEEILQDEGAYHASGLYIVGGAASNTRLLGYKIPNIHLNGKVVYTNTVPSAPVRGTGVRQLCFSRESLLSEIADDLGLDPIEMRTQQSVSNDECPYEEPTGNVLLNTGLDAAIETAVDEIDYETLKESIADEPYTGIGVAVGYHVSSCRGRLHDSDQTTVDMRVQEDGTITVRTVACDMGTSTRTTLTQVCADALGVDPADVRIIDNDTQMTPPGDGSHSSRTMTMMGTATHQAAEAVRENLAKMAANHLEAASEDLVFEDSEVRIKGTDRGVDFGTLAEIAHHSKEGTPEGMTAGDLAVSATFDTKDEDVPVETTPTNEEAIGNISVDYPSSCQIVVASVDPDTGRVSIDEHVAVDDCGTAVNPLVVEGQIEGGVVQGAGMALSEELSYDSDTGQLLNSNFSDYGIPTAPEAPKVDGDFVEVPSETTPGGWKGVAEGPFIVAPAAVANAVSDAVGVPAHEVPLTPERVKRAIENGEYR